MIPFKQDIDLGGCEILNFRPHVYTSLPAFVAANDAGRLIQVLQPTRQMYFGGTAAWIPVDLGTTLLVSNKRVFEIDLDPPAGAGELVHVHLTVATNSDFSGTIVNAFTKSSILKWAYSDKVNGGLAYPAGGLTDVVYQAADYRARVSYYDPAIVFAAGTVYYVRWNFRRDIGIAPFYETYYTRTGRFVQ